MKAIVKSGALLLCILFFTLPLVQCTHDTSLNASGWEISTGTGDLFSTDDSGYPLVFLLLIIPIVLLVMALIGKSFEILRNISIIGLIIKIIFLIYTSILLNSDDFRGIFQLTWFNWLVLGIYLGLCIVTFYCSNNPIFGDANAENEESTFSELEKSKYLGKYKALGTIYAREDPKLFSKYLSKIGFTKTVTVTDIGKEISENKRWFYIESDDGKKGWCYSDILEKL